MKTLTHKSIPIFFFVIFFTHNPTVALAQVEANLWYFGAEAGIDFSKNPPIALKDGKLNTVEGCATISDEKGNLLFYTDGITLWNKTHEVMQNGADLLGDPSATQSAVIVPIPQQKDLCYVFTVDDSAQENGVRYNLIDLKANNGLGAIIEKNKPLLAPTAEKITAVRHQNNQDVWLITHKWNTDEYYCYLITEKGLQTKSIINKIGSIHEANEGNAIGYLKASPDGKRIAAAIKNLSIFELFDFDNQTGKMSNSMQFSLEGDARTYGIEFSSDGTKMYGTTLQTKELYQFDLTLQTQQAIQNAKYLVAKLENPAGALQLANDGKIYLSVYESEYLGVIQNPNSSGNKCNFTAKGIYLEGKQCRLGLPTFVQTYFEDRENISKISTNSDTKVKLNEPFTKNILFDVDKFDINPKHFVELDELVNYLRIAQHIKITITGHTDSDGEKEKNLILSQNRAKAIATYLNSKGIENNRITYQGFGETKPITSNDTQAGKAQNRRIEFTLIK